MPVARTVDGRSYAPAGTGAHTNPSTAARDRARTERDVCFPPPCVGHVWGRCRAQHNGGGCQCSANARPLVDILAPSLRHVRSLPPPRLRRTSPAQPRTGGGKARPRTICSPNCASARSARTLSLRTPQTSLGGGKMLACDSGARAAGLHSARVSALYRCGVELPAI